MGLPPPVHLELVLLAAVGGFHGRSEKSALPLPLHCFISLAVLGTPAGPSFGKFLFFFFSFKYVGSESQLYPLI